jgi:malate dehydrogenase (oxaloacetate-decarboxylating)
MTQFTPQPVCHWQLLQRRPPCHAKACDRCRGASAGPSGYPRERWQRSAGPAAGCRHCLWRCSVAGRIEFILGPRLPITLTCDSIPPAAASSAAPPTSDAPAAASPSGAAIATPLRGGALLAQPLLNKGTAFSRQERRDLQLEALLPWEVETIDQQVERSRQALAAMASDLERYAWLQMLRERNVVLFQRLLAEHIETVMPLVYTPTVGQAIQAFSHTYRSPAQGVFLSAPMQPRLREVLHQAIAGFSPSGADWRPQLLLVTDAEGILGIGDQGAGGIHICQGKLAVYSLCAGIDPATTLPVMLDVGTDRPELLADPLYPGLRQPRLRGEAYDAFVATFVAAVAELCPEALVQWEDFGATNARRVLEAHRQTIASFNDDIQGTSGVACAAILAGLQGLGRALGEAPIVIFGAGTAGCGIAERLLRLLHRQGLDEAEALGRLWLLDRRGLVYAGREGIRELASPWAADAARMQALAAAGLRPDRQGQVGLRDLIEAIRPAVLIGTSTVAGAFDRPVIEALCRGCERPIVLPLSNPTHLAEVTPADLLAWSQGRALVATGSPFAPVPVQGRLRPIGQCNNCFVFPGLGLGALAVGAREVSEAMIDASLEALAARIPAAADPEASLMPPLQQVQEVSQAVAEAVALTAVAEGLARRASSAAEALACLEQQRWRPDYPQVIAA